MMNNCMPWILPILTKSPIYNTIMNDLATKKVMNKESFVIINSYIRRLIFLGVLKVFCFVF